MTRECGEYVPQKAQNEDTKRHKLITLSVPLALVPLAGFVCAFCGNYFPRIIQSPCDVPINSNIGNDSHVFVRDAINA
jgi:hypothetical protein